MYTLKYRFHIENVTYLMCIGKKRLVKETMQVAWDVLRRHWPSQ